MFMWVCALIFISYRADIEVLQLRVNISYCTCFLGALNEEQIHVLNTRAHTHKLLSAALQMSEGDVCMIIFAFEIHLK